MEVLAVDLVVVSVAEEDEVFEVCGAHVSPVGDVVGVAVAHGPVASGVAAASVAGGDDAEQVGGDGVGATPVACWDTVGVAGDPV